VVGYIEPPQVCSSTRKDGQPCGGVPVRDTDSCAAHSRTVR
jgi:hypothetical protein